MEQDVRWYPVSCQVMWSFTNISSVVSGVCNSNQLFYLQKLPIQLYLSHSLHVTCKTDTYRRAGQVASCAY